MRLAARVSTRLSRSVGRRRELTHHVRVMTTSTFTIERLARPDGTSVAVYSWPPPRAPKALVQIVHGLAEHAGRYERLAVALTQAGYAVYASDHRGHGQTPQGPRDYGHFADREGFDRVVEDVHAVNQHVAAKHAKDTGLKHVLFGHSFGSFVAQRYLGQHGNTLQGAVLSGTASGAAALLRVALGIAGVERLRLGGRNQSALLQKLTFGSYNDAFKPTSTDFDWLSRDAGEVAKYIADPLCGFAVTTQAWCDLLGGMLGNEDAGLRARIPKHLPIYVIAGAVDPNGRAGQGPKALALAYERAGLDQVTLRLYPGARHELVNETNREEVTHDLIAWLDAHVSASS
jgi:alpha-beta hydrolase superfamily lysophospholipase